MISVDSDWFAREPLSTFALCICTLLLSVNGMRSCIAPLNLHIDAIAQCCHFRLLVLQENGGFLSFASLTSFSLRPFSTIVHIELRL